MAVIIGLIAILFFSFGCNKPGVQKGGTSNSDSIRCEIYVKYMQPDSILITSPSWSGYLKTTHKTIKGNVVSLSSPQIWLIECMEMNESGSDTLTLKVYENGVLKSYGTAANVISYSLTY